MTKKSNRSTQHLSQEELDQINNEKAVREEAIEGIRRQMQKANHDHMESVIDGIADHGLDVIKHPIFQHTSRTISNQVVTYQSRIFTSPIPP